MKCKYEEAHLELSDIDYTDENYSKCPAGWYVRPPKENYHDTGWFEMNEMVFLRRWCKQNLTHEWIITSQWLYIANNDDATLFKLTWLNDTNT